MMNGLQKSGRNGFILATLPVVILLAMLFIAQGSFFASTSAGTDGVGVSDVSPGVVSVSWTEDEYPVHRVGWANASDVAAALEAGEWLEAFQYSDTRRKGNFLVKHLAPDSHYYFIVGAGHRRFGNVAWSNWVSFRTAAADSFDVEPVIPDDMQVALARFVAVEVVGVATHPPQYFANLRVVLPNACVAFHDYELSQDGDTTRISVWTLEPGPDAGLACAAVESEHLLSVPLGSDFTRGVEYVLLVNGVGHSFTPWLE